MQAIVESLHGDKTTLATSVDFAAALQRLVERGYLAKEGTHYHFADEIFRRWVSLRHKPTDVIKEEFVEGAGVIDGSA